MAHPGFFERQASARRNTLILVLLFLTAVVLITLAVCLVGYVVTSSESSGLAFHHWLASQHGVITSAAVVALIGIGSLVRWVDLAGGGERVARMVGARDISPDTRDADERTLRNVVEEMAIASGVPVPQLYVMDHETGINAFVAGYAPGEAVMVVTHGALTQLNRDELQGVVAHEFSHILNGDMRLNVRLIAILAGILMVGQIGSFLMRASFHRSHRSSRSSGDGRAQAALGLIGLALLVIGYIGVFFGRLIQSAVSRQRETLADASSVQFTRNPEGIAGALFKIGLKGGYLDTTSHASDMNHMCFAESARMKLASLLASHPPVEARINAIEPGMLARLRSRLRDTEAVPPRSAAPSPDTGTPMSGQTLGFSGQVGRIPETAEVYARSLLSELPATFRGLLYTRAGAVQLCYALLIRTLPRTEQETVLSQIPSHPLLSPQRDLLDKLLPTLERQGAALQFPVLELAMPALRKLDPDERQGLHQAVRRLIRADGTVSLSELALISFLERHLAPEAPRVVPVSFRRYSEVEGALRCLLSLFARAGAADSTVAEKLYQQAMASFTPAGAEGTLAIKVSLKNLQEALHRLNRLSPLLKPAIIDACGYCVTHDGQVAANEYDLMRLVADQLDCPMPPLSV